MIARKFAIAGALCSAAVCLLAGCATDPTKGYTFQSQYPSNIRTVSVPIWTRGPEVYRRGLEISLTEALVKQIEHDMRCKVTKTVRADAELTGTIKRVTQQILSTNPDDGRPREMEVTLLVSFQFKDLRTGKTLERDNFKVTGSYVPSTPFLEEFHHGSEDTINRLARRIVEELREDW